MKKQFYTVATIIVMGITANAQVGIGTTTPDPSSLLEIKSTTKGLLMPRLSASEMFGVPAPALGLQVFNTTTNTFWYYNGVAWVNTSASNEPWFNQATNSGATANTQNIYQMGNVGIGTAPAPAYKLHINGQAKFNGGFPPTIFESSAWDNGGLRLDFIGGTSTDFRFFRQSENVLMAHVDSRVGDKFQVAASGGLVRLSVNGSDGFVGIGTTTPSTMLHVNGTITATKIQGPSDSRFKKNIKPIKNALEKVMKLGGYTYDWKDASEFPNQTLGKGHDMGVIAQEVEKQFPEAVSTNADGFKAVSYTELVPALIEAIKAQQAEIEILKATVAKLKK